MTSNASAQCVEQNNLTSGIPNLEFARAVDIETNRIVVGSLDYANGIESGSAYVYTWTGSSWAETKLTASDGFSNSDFGYSIATSGNRVVVGAPGAGVSGTNSGDIYIYDWTGSTWVETKLSPSDGFGNDNFGNAVDIDGDRIVVGSFKDDDYGTDSGAIYIYDWNGSSWVETKINPFDGWSFDGFGIDVGISGDRILVGSYYDDDAGSNSGSAYLYDWDGSAWNVTKLGAVFGSADDYYGTSVDIDGDRLVIGAVGEDDNGIGSGSAYIYDWDGSSWVETKIAPSDGASSDYFGTNVSIDGDRIVIDAYRDDDNGIDSGSAYIFDWDGSSWVETKLVASDGSADDNYGSDVAVLNDRVVIGSFHDDDNGFDTGSAYIYDLSGGSWTESKITPSDGFSFDRFGISLAVDNDRIVVGAIGDDTNGTDAGAIFIHDWDGTTWISTKVTASDGDVNDRFGADVGISLDRVVVGAPGDDDNGTSSGSMYVYSWDGSAWNEEKILSNDAAAFDNFGESVSIDVDRIAVGAFGESNYEGAVYVYDWTGSSWSETKLTASDGSGFDYLGASVSVSGNRVLAGAHFNDDNGLDSGSAYLFEKNGGTWTETLLLASDGNNSDNFGKSVSISGDRIVVGSESDDDNGPDSGSAYIYDWDGSTWIETKLTASDGASFDKYGASVSVSGNRIAIGASQHDANGSNSGSVYLYEWDGSTWVETKLVSSSSYAGSESGSVVAISNDYLVMGIPDMNTATIFQCGCPNPPTALCKNITITLDNTGFATITAQDLDDGSSDDCSTLQLGISQSTFDCSNVGSNPVTLTATDDDGNSSTCSAMVTVIDNNAPSMACSDLTLYLGTTGNVSLIPAFIDNGSSDECGLASMSLSQTFFDCSDIGPNMITLTATDASGNANTCTSTVTILDNLDPTAVCQDITVSLDANGAAVLSPLTVDDGSYDNCNISNWVLDIFSFNCNDIGTKVVTLTITDSSGNTSTCTSNVTILDSGGVCCPLTLTESSIPITDGYYQSDQSINSAGMVPSNGNVSFGSSTICLDNGFEVQVGGEFTAEINPCISY